MLHASSPSPFQPVTAETKLVRIREGETERACRNRFTKAFTEGTVNCQILDPLQYETVFEKYLGLGGSNQSGLVFFWFFGFSLHVVLEKWTHLASQTRKSLILTVAVCRCSPLACWSPVLQSTSLQQQPWSNQNYCCKWWRCRGSVSNKSQNILVGTAFAHWTKSRWCQLRQDIHWNTFDCLHNVHCCFCWPPIVSWWGEKLKILTVIQ